MKFYEFRCKNCGARFNPPDGYFSKHSNVRKLIPRNLKLFARHRPVVGKLKDFEELFLMGRKVVRKLALVTGNPLEHEWEEDNSGLKPIYIPAYTRYCEAVDSGRLRVLRKATIEEFARDHGMYDEIQELINECRNLNHPQLKRSGDDIVIYANKDDHIIETEAGKKRVVLLDRDHVDADGSYCYNFTIEAEDFEEVPMRATVETRRLVDGRTEYILKCPECGKVAIRVRK